MSHENLRRASSCILAAVVILISGCYDTTLPQSLKVAMPDDTSLEAPIHSGPPQLIDSTWALYEKKRADDPRDGAASPLIRIEFGSEGEVVRAFDNTEFGTEYIGDTLIPDGALHAGIIPGSSYVGQSYGAGVGPNLGFTAMGKFLVGPAEAVVASLTASGTLNEAADRFEGTVSYHLELNREFSKLLEDLIGHEDEQRNVVAFREK